MDYLIGFVVGIAGVALILFLAFLYLKRKMLRMLSELSKHGGLVPPFRISLRKNEDEKWDNLEAIQGATEQLELFSYKAIGDYVIDELNNCKLRAFFSEKNNAYAVIYEHPQAGVWVDAQVFLADGTGITVTTMKDQGLDQPSFVSMTYLEIDLLKEPFAVKEVVAVLQEKSERKKLQETEAENFEKEFIQAYRRAMNWRIEQGGVTREEICRVAEISGGEVPTDEDVDLVQKHWDIAIADTIEQDVRESYLKEVSAAEWEEKECGIYIIHDRLNKELFVDDLTSRIEDSIPRRKNRKFLRNLEETIKVLMEKSSIRETVDEILSALPEEAEVKKLKSLSVPWAADIYYFPAIEEDWDDDDYLDEAEEA